MDNVSLSDIIISVTSKIKDGASCSSPDHQNQQNPLSCSDWLLSAQYDKACSYWLNLLHHTDIKDQIYSAQHLDPGVVLSRWSGLMVLVVSGFTCPPARPGPRPAPVLPPPSPACERPVVTGKMAD